ncbi:hypothetical protein TNCV_4824361 [Trichonephila clavipes]|nr:hypothetical protein TNCV_4824361 [Trichonephila clavipes]
MFSMATASGHLVNRSTIVVFPDDGKGPSNPHECLHQLSAKVPRNLKMNWIFDSLHSLSISDCVVGTIYMTTSVKLRYEI